MRKGGTEKKKKDRFSKGDSLTEYGVQSRLGLVVAGLPWLT